MKCVSCGAEIPAEYKFAIKNNVCPVCGGQLLDDKILKSIVKAIQEEVPSLNEETAKNLGVALISKFQFGSSEQTSKVEAEQKKVSSKKDEILAQIQSVQEEEDAIVQEHDEMDQLKDEAFEEVLRERYPEMNSAMQNAPRKKYPKMIDDEDILEDFEKNIGHQLIDQKRESARSGLASGKGGFRRG